MSEDRTYDYRQKQLWLQPAWCNVSVYLRFLDYNFMILIVCGSTLGILFLLCMEMFDVSLTFKAEWFLLFTITWRKNIDLLLDGRLSQSQHNQYFAIGNFLQEWLPQA